MLLRPPAGSPIQQLSLVGGLAVAEAVEDALQLAAQLKWPNDVMVDRRKVAGILAEAHDGIVVLGIGLNVNQTRDELPADARVPAASLRTVDGEVRDLAPLLADLLARLELHYDAWAAGGLDAVFDGIGSRDFLRGRRVRIDGHEGVGAGSTGRAAYWWTAARSSPARSSSSRPLGRIRRRRCPARSAAGRRRRRGSPGRRAPYPLDVVRARRVVAEVSIRKPFRSCNGLSTRK